NSSTSGCSALAAKYCFIRGVCSFAAAIARGSWTSGAKAASLPHPFALSADAAARTSHMQVPDDARLHAQAAALGARLREQRHTLVTAESCTGGWIAKVLTDIEGSSAWFDCGLATYSYEAKQALLGVSPLT